jgi:hypothetical protein
MRKQTNESPIGQRTPQPIFPAGFIYFRHWTSLRWYLLLVVPIAISVCVCIRRHQIGFAVGVLTFGLVVTAILFVAICSGKSSSNWGTYFKLRDPLGYWLDIAVLVGAYAGLALAGWFA